MERKTCCGLLTLMTGSTIVGALWLVFDISFSIMFLTFLSSTRRAFFNMGAYWTADEFDKAIIGAMCYFSMMIILDSILIYGIRVRKRTLMIPWLCVVALQLIAALVIFIIIFVDAIQRTTDAGPLVLVFCLFFAPFLMATNLYKVVYTYFKDLRNQMQSGQTFQIVLPSSIQSYPYAQGGFQPLGVQYLPPAFGKSQSGGIQYEQSPQKEFQHTTIPRAHVNTQMGMG